MQYNPNKLIININDDTYPNWRYCLQDQLKDIKSNSIEINCGEIDLSCTDLLYILKISEKFNCKIISFSSTSLNTIVSSSALGYPSQFIVEDHSKHIPTTTKKNLDFSNIRFHQGTLRSGEYLESAGDLLIFGDVNPGALVSAEGDVIIWGKLLGIAHAGSKGNSKAKIAALHLKPVQLRIANKIARGPKEKPQLGFAEQATIDSEKIIISPLESF